VLIFIKEEIMQPNPTKLLDRAGIRTPLIGFSDAPDSSPFEPTV
jgi:hypothetical protein